MRKKYRKATSSTSFLVDSCNASWSSEQKLCWSCEKRAPWDLEDKMDDLKEGRERKQISLRQRALALFHHVLSAPSEIILSRASEKMSHLHLSPYNTRRLFASSDCDFWPRQCFDFCVHSVQSTAEIYSQLKRSSFTKENWPNGAIFSASSLCKRRRV